MKAALSAEWRKLTTTSLWWILALVMFGYMAFLGAVMGFSLTQDAGSASAGMGGDDNLLSGQQVAQSVYTIGATLGYVFPLVAGAIAVTSEFRHQTITPTFLFEPRRGVVLTAKMLVNLAMGVVYGVVGTLGAIAGGAPLLGTLGDGLYLTNADVLGNVAFSVLALAIWAVIGVGLGSVLPNQVAAIVVILAFTQFVEPILRVGLTAVDALAGVAKFLPGAAAEALVGESLYSTTGMLDLLGRWEGAAILLVYAVVFAAIGRYTTIKRDVT